jgi:hypothetical protein
MFTSEFYDTSFIDNGNKEEIKLDKMKIILTTTIDQKNNNNENETSIDLGKCENLLRKFYNITDGKIYVKKVDVIQDNWRIPKIGYEVYSKINGTNLVKLNLSVCGTSKIFLLIPVEISENLDKLNTSSDYFNNICYTINSENGAYIPLKDRQKEFIERKKTLCQEDCYLNDYNYTAKKANCSCKPKEKLLSFIDMHINKTKLYNNFVDIKNVANINILTCYKTLLTKDSLIYNVGSYIVIAILIFHIICIIIFYTKQFDLLKLKIKDIVFAIKNLSHGGGLGNIKKTGRKLIKGINANNRNRNRIKDDTKSTRNILKKNENNKNKNNSQSIQLKDQTKNKKYNKLIKKINKPCNNNCNLKKERNDNFFKSIFNNINFRNKNNQNKINNNNKINNQIKNNNNIINRNNNQIHLKNNFSNFMSQSIQRTTLGRNNINTSRLKTNAFSKRTDNNQKIEEKVQRILDFIDQ